MILNDTPVEIYGVQGIPVCVKREDLCCPDGPPFSKMRGIYQRLEKLKQQGIETIGYVETSISMAGWGLAWLGDKLGLKVIIYDPQYVTDQSVLENHRKMWKKYNAEIIPIKAGMACVNYNICKKKLKQDFGNDAILLPLGLPFSETVDATAKEFSKHQEYKSVVVNVGSGTICSGLVKGCVNKSVAIYGIMGRTGNVEKKKSGILKKSDRIGLYFNDLKFNLIDPGYEYTQAEIFPVPFPCNPYYDRKAWKWLNDYIDELEQPILFWNIGA